MPMTLVIARRYARRSGVLSWLEGNLPHPDLGLSVYLETSLLKDRVEKERERE